MHQLIEQPAPKRPNDSRLVFFSFDFFQNVFQWRKHLPSSIRWHGAHKENEISPFFRIGQPIKPTATSCSERFNDSDGLTCFRHRDASQRHRFWRTRNRKATRCNWNHFCDVMRRPSARTGHQLFNSQMEITQRKVEWDWIWLAFARRWMDRARSPFIVARTHSHSNPPWSIHPRATVGGQSLYRRYY